MDKANINSRSPLDCANSFILNPTIRQNAKTVSAVVPIIANVGIKKFWDPWVYQLCIFKKNIPISSG